MNFSGNRHHHDKQHGHKRKKDDRQHPVLPERQHRAQNQCERNGRQRAHQRVDHVADPVHVLDRTGDQRARSDLSEFVHRQRICLSVNFRAKFPAKFRHGVLTDFVCGHHQSRVSDRDPRHDRASPVHIPKILFVDPVVHDVRHQRGQSHRTDRGQYQQNERRSQRRPIFFQSSEYISHRQVHRARAIFQKLPQFRDFSAAAQFSRVAHFCTLSALFKSYLHPPEAPGFFFRISVRRRQGSDYRKKRGSFLGCGASGVRRHRADADQIIDRKRKQHAARVRFQPRRLLNRAHDGQFSLAFG